MTEREVQLLGFEINHDDGGGNLGGYNDYENNNIIY